MGKRSRIFTHILTAVAWQASASGERAAREDVRRENELLWTEVDNLQRELKKLKQVIEHLHREYEQSKDYDPVRRYARLKGMIKRTLMHLRLNPDDPGSTSSQGLTTLVQGCRDHTHQMESARRREDKYLNMTRQELSQENIQLQQQTRELRRKAAIIRDVVFQLEKNYGASKRFAVIQRYSMLKRMIKTVTYDKLLTEFIV